MSKKIIKTSLVGTLSEYLEDLQRAGIQDYIPPISTSRASSSSPVSTPLNPGLPVLEPSDRISSPARNKSENETGESSTEQNREKILAGLANDVKQCQRCPELVANRTNTVFGSGNPYAELVFLGEGPGADEDRQGLPFVGRSGQLLTDIITHGMGLKREDVYICNIVRCRPPGNRNPSPAEAQCCRPFLDATLAVVQPKFICCLGSIAATNLLNTDTPIGKLRGRAHDYYGIQVVCTYHPAYLLRNPPAKKLTWEDIQLLMKIMGIPVPQRK